ncbi:helix-turn-helix domain-containing protein [Acinetobacter sp. YK3]|uniref:helix-turn-helix domain-containing protein n=1 Tax=Acinetobacter sp. YK3 TaxID=1860097 RepID=UPI00084CC413|nr:LexA family transcriptional regulator [Acinetobacter sp. YK3]OEC84755.1 repressor [Acinetobacter sp. YK3]
MRTLAERLRYAMEVLPPKKIKGVDLARAVGVKPPSVSDWLSGKSKTMEGENLLKVSKFLGVNINWLATGNGSPIEKNKQEKDGLDSTLLRDHNLQKIPLLNYAEVDLWKKIQSHEIEPKKHTYTVSFSNVPESLFSLIVQGNSMEPEFKEGDILIVDTLTPPKPGNYVISINGSHEALFRKYRVACHDKNGKEIFELIPINQDYPVISSMTHDIKIIGVVKRYIRDLKI